MWFFEIGHLPPFPLGWQTSVGTRDHGEPECPANLRELVKVLRPEPPS
jgi:hypothetical protein